MKNVFIPLTVTEPDTPREKEEYLQLGHHIVWVNMSRCQEIYARKRGGSELIMNIPDYAIHVAEPPAAIIALLREANANDDGDR